MIGWRGSRCGLCYWALYDGNWCQNPDCSLYGNSVDAQRIYLNNQEAQVLIAHRRRCKGMKKEDLISEKQQVDARHAALSEQLRNPEFTRSLPGVQDGLLRRELGILEQYSLILGERINNFFDPVAGQKEGIAIPEDQKARDEAAQVPPNQREAEANASMRQRDPASKQAQRNPDQEQEQPLVRQQRQQEQQQAPKAKAAPVKKLAVRKTAPRLVAKVQKVASKSKK